MVEHFLSMEGAVGSMPTISIFYYNKISKQTKKKKEIKERIKNKEERKEYDKEKKKQDKTKQEDRVRR